MNEPKLLKRPKPGDDEEELLRMQEEFLQSRQEPSAKVINLRSQNIPDRTFQDRQEPVEVPKFRSKFAERRANKSRLPPPSTGPMINPQLLAQENLSKNISDNLDPIQNIPSAPPSIILGNIIEKKFGSSQISSSSSQNPTEDSGFPEVFLITKKPKIDSATSLFYANLPQNSEPKIGSTSKFSDSKTGSASKSSDQKLGKNFIQNSLHSDIHEENLEKLSKMSQAEILHEKCQLEAALSPDLIKFIKSRKNSKIISKESPNTPKSDDMLELSCESDKMKMDVEDVGTEQNESATVADILQKATENRWVHMDEVEGQKLEWMKDLENKSEVPGEPYGARFSFDGVLLPFKDDSIGMDQGLHHHGEEPDRPGYSLQELLQLTRSSNQQQRCTALTTLANIMEKSRKGWYDRVLDPQPISALHSRNILLLLRFALDDSSVAVVTAALQALRAFLYSEPDEICLDRLSPWTAPRWLSSVPELSPPKTDITDATTLKDHELCHLDCISTALRSDLLLRLRFILSEMRPPSLAVTSSLEILIRLARHSKTTSLNIACTPHLLPLLIEHFIPLTTSKLLTLDHEKPYGVPSLTALRLLRVLTNYAGKPVADRLDRLKLIPRLITYITTDSGEAGLRLSTEALRLWKALITNNAGADSTSGAALTLNNQLQLLLSNHNIDSPELPSEYATALIDLSSHEPALQPILSTLLSKWSAQLENLSKLTWTNAKLVAVVLNLVQDTSSFRTKWVSNDKIFEGILGNSNLLCGQVKSSRDLESLPGLGVLTDGGQVQPIVSLSSVVPFLATVVNVLLEKGRFSELISILGNSWVRRYVDELGGGEWSLEGSWYSRCEVFLVAGLVKAAARIGSPFWEKMVKIAFKLISTLPSDAPDTTKDILRLVLSAGSGTRIGGLAQKMGSMGLEEVDRADVPNISAIYERFISKGTWDQSALPKDWPYLPLVSSYASHKEDKSSDSDTENIAALLRLEVDLPDVFRGLSPSLRFSRLILVYLCDTICLNATIAPLLRKIVPGFLGNFYGRLNFAEDVPGVSSFTDLFASLCENFCANSYGDECFSMVVLAFIGQRHDKYFRKILWSEHAGALRYIRLRRERLPVEFREFLAPVEEDLSLIEEYLTALVRGTVREEWSPVMYEIALHHSAMFLKGEGAVARRMRERIEGIPDERLRRRLLDYQAPAL